MSHSPPIVRSYIRDLPLHIGQRIKLKGFAETIRDQKRMRFIILRDSTGKVQLTQSKENVGLNATLDVLTPESSLIVTGTVTAAPGVKLGGLEVILDSVKTCGLADAHLPIARDSGLEKWIDHRQVSLRYPEQQLVTLPPLGPDTYRYAGHAKLYRCCRDEIRQHVAMHSILLPTFASRHFQPVAVDSVGADLIRATQCQLALAQRSSSIL